jgi:tRNA pseudouridine38-40 synthase
LWYRGDLFRGYQSQIQGPTVQQALEEALRKAGVHGYFAASGRTDKGVHARMQVVSGRLRLEAEIGDFAAALRGKLPEGLGLCAARPTHPSFHAQWSCAGKEYRYRIALPGADPAWAPYAWTPERPFSIDVLARTLGACVGAHDFIAFHEKSSPRKVRTIESADLVDRGAGLVEARIRGNGFGRHQVRYMVGSAMEVAGGGLPADAFAAAVERAEPIRGVRAPAAGLILWDVRYPGQLDPFGSDRAAPGPLPQAPPFV